MLFSSSIFYPRVRAVLKWSMPMLGVVALTGCAYAPGLRMGKPADTGSANPWSITAVRGTADASSPTSEVADVPPVGALIAITPELLLKQRTNSQTNVLTDVKKFFDTTKPYQISPGDVLNIVVWDHPELSAPSAAGQDSSSSTSSSASSGSASGPAGYNVSLTGMIQFPYVGVVKLIGLTEYEARDLLIRRLSKYFKNPEVTVRVQAYRGGRVYIDGEVRTPGLQAIDDLQMNLPELIGRAGGLTAIADRSAIAVTRNGETTVIDFNKLVEQGVNPSNVVLRAGDLVRVLSREENRIFVLGEVSHPSTQNLRNGRLTLSEALGDSGGVSQISGDPRQIFVVRTTKNFENPTIYHLDGSSAAAYALASGFELKSRDVVYVDAAPLVRWSRVVSLILPSAQAANAARSATN